MKTHIGRKWSFGLSASGRCGGAVLIICLIAGGCKSPSSSKPSINSQLELLLPQKIEIMPFTKLRSWDDDQLPDGIEVVLRPLDAFDDQTKAIGTFRFELHLFRKASSDSRGTRIGFWEVDITNKKAQMQHWDPITCTYRFRLQWDGPAPLPGKYVLQVTYISPWARRISDLYILELREHKLLLKEKAEQQLQNSG